MVCRFPIATRSDHATARENSIQPNVEKRRKGTGMSEIRRSRCRRHQRCDVRAYRSSSSMISFKRSIYIGLSLRFALSAATADQCQNERRSLATGSGW
jgi:hypothetical protein